MRWPLLVAFALPLAFASTGLAQANQAPAENDVGTHLSQGTAFMRSGQSENALEEFQVASRLDPNATQALVWLGITYNQLGRFQEAITAFLKALKLDSSVQSAHYNLALSYARLGQRKDAIRELREVIRASPSMPDAQYNLAVLLEQEGNAEEAVPHLEVARSARTEDTDIGLHLARDLFLTGHSNEGLELTNQLAHQSDAAKIAKPLGEILIENGYFAEAVPLLESARNESPNSIEFTSLLARAYIGSQSASKAIDLLKPHEDSDNSGDVAYLLGLAYLSNKQPVAALESFRIAAERRPADAAVHFHLGALLLKSSHEADQNIGITELQKAIELAPRQTEYYAALGRWLLEHNRINDAVSVLENGKVHAPPAAELYVLLSIAQALSQSAEAQATAEKAVALDPKIALAHNVLGFCYFRAGDYLRAADSYKTASELNSQSGRFAYDTALALERANKPAEALLYAERAAKNDPSVALNHYLLGKLYSRLEKNADSVRELEVAARLEPSLDYPYYLLARTYMRMGDMAKAQEWNRKLQELKKQQMTIHGMGSMSSEHEEPPSLLLEKGHSDSDSAER